ncbi:MAG: 2-oxoglutarate dehydrogenase, E2 component, dihydrolipoamide succinyltransferase, partial [Nakamurella sp.]
MSQSVQMPALGESVTEGTVTRWLKSEGDSVEVDEPLVEVSTDKVDTEIPSPYAGVLEKILVAEDETAQVGADLAIIGDGSGSGDGAAPAEAPTEFAPADEGVPEVPSTDAPAPGEAETAHAPEPAAAPPADPAPSGGSGGGSDGSAPAGGSGTSVKLPEMGESVTEGTVTRWLKAVGDEVAVDEPLVEVSTDKVDTEVPSPVGGTLLSITVGEDETVQVGGELAVIGDAGAAPAPAPDKAPEDKAPEPAKAPAAAAPSPTPAKPHDPAPRDADAPAPAAPQRTAAPADAPAVAADKPTEPKANWQPAPSTGGTYVTPVIRKLASDNGIDLASVTGTGVGNRIRREDINAAISAKAEAEAAAASSAAAAPAGAPTAAAAPKAEPSEAAKALIGTTQKLPRIRQSIAKNMVYGLQTAAQLTTVIEVDVTRVAALRAKAKSGFASREGVNLSFLPFFVKAAIEALKLYPVVNSTLSEDL